MGRVYVVNPCTRKLLDKFYSQALTCVRVNPSGHNIVHVFAYGSYKSDSFQVHKLEIYCSAQGFALTGSGMGSIGAPFGNSLVRLPATLGASEANDLLVRDGERNRA